MIKGVINAGRYVAAKPATRNFSRRGAGGVAGRFDQFFRSDACIRNNMQYFRDFSTRGRGTRQGLQYSRRPQGQHQHQHKKTRVDFQGVTVVSVGVVAGGLMIWLGNQDAAPYTNRKRFMLVDRDGSLLKGVSASTWTSVKKQYASDILPKTHQATRTVERIGTRIADASGLENCKWEFIVVKNDTMNAFALPGGKAFPVVSESLRTASTMSHHEQVVVFTGLFQAAPNADALASVLGHEVGHVVANHGGEKLSKNLLTDGFLLLLFMLTGFDYFHAARSIGNLIFDLPNSREMEREADYIGMQLMAKACFDPHEMPKTFARMKEAAAMKGVQKGSAYLSTHPADDERIAKQKEWMDSALQTRERSGCTDLRRWGLVGKS